MKTRVHFSVGTTAYNEAKNIQRFIDAVQHQKLDKQFKLKELIVIASGCTDNTVNLVKKLAKKDKRIRLIVESERRGKAVAVNTFIKSARSKHIILQSTDTIPKINCYNRLLEKLIKKNVGLVAARVFPKDSKKNTIGLINHFKWRLHHKINIKYPQRPKVGEIVCFKKVFERIPPKTAVDEASIEPLIHLQGFQIVYQPKAIVYNQGPKTLREYLSQRRRIYAGHYTTKKKYAYEIITLKGTKILPIYLKSINPSVKSIYIAIVAASLEVIARSIGFFDILFNKRDHAVWKVAPSSKRLPE